MTPRVRRAVKRAQKDLVSRPQAARHVFRRLAHTHPQLAPAWLGLARAARQDAFAARLWQRVIALEQGPDAGEAWLNLALIRHRRGDLVGELRALERSLLLRPDSAAASMRMGSALAGLGQNQAALTFYLRALELDPGEQSLYLALAELLESQGDFDAVMECLRSLCIVQPQMIGMVSFYMGFLLEKRGELAAALLCYDKALESLPLPEWRLKRELAFEMVMESREAIDACRARLDSVLDAYLASGRHSSPRLPVWDAITLNMAHIAYHHYSPLALRQKLARLMSAQAPQLPALPAARPEGPIHLGVIIAPQMNTALGYVGGLLNRLDPRDFVVTVFCASAGIRLALEPDAAVRLRHPQLRLSLLGNDYETAAARIRAAAPDALFFTEPGWDPLQYRLGLLRLAPVQFTCWINPGTTGVDTMDYFLSTSLMEEPSAQAEYSEQLELFRTVPVCFPHVEVPALTMTRADFGLPESGALYVCPHNMLKFHPDFDLLIADILAADPDAHLALTIFKGQENLADLLVRRFLRRIPGVMERIWVLPQLARPEFFNLLQLSDLLLDPLYYGGGTISYQAFASGLPVLTLPGERLLSRCTLGYYNKMTEVDPEGFSQCIAGNQADYVAKAVELANDAALRGTLSQRIQAASSHLFEDQAACAEFEAFLRRVCR